jgi:uncharacterized protein (DUF1800 family)
MYDWMRCLKGVVVGALVASLCGCPTDNGAGDIPQTRADAWRFLTQATFGPDEANIARVMTIGYSAWIDEQFATQSSFSFKNFFSEREAELKADHPGVYAAAGTDQVLEAFFTRALTDKAQLRARLSFALSEIFVVSYADAILNLIAPAMVASFEDTLDAGVDGSYRDLLEAVTKAPAMGHYLTYRGNLNEYPAAGRYPDENYAREVMQLFSIGLYELNPDGTLRLDSNGKPTETYTSADIKGLAKVFTGWGNYRSAAYSSVAELACFQWAGNCHDPEGFVHPMVAYPSYHSVSAKSFLGITIPAQSSPDPQGSLTAALNRLATHPNTAPFISKQLIQRFVTSNPSPDYVKRVAAKFTATGGNLKETIKAILLDDEARGPLTLISETHGKLREPILRLTAILRAFQFDSPTLSPPTSLMDNVGTQRIPYLSVGNTSDPATSFGQAPFFSPSVFNFFRPGYTPPQSQSSSRQLVAPEMQLNNESSVIGYFNVVQDLLTNGIGPNVVVDQDGQCGVFTVEVQQYIQSLDPKVPANKALQTAAANCKLETISRRNVTMQLVEQRSIATDVPTLVQHMADRLHGGTLSPDLAQTMTDALNSIQIPALNAAQSNGADINSALDKRVLTAILMVAVSPEFLVTK